jgi:hypothetical protein
MADKKELQLRLNELVKSAADLPPGPGREIVTTAISQSQSTFEIALADDGTMNANALVLSGKAFKRLNAEPTNGTSWCC